MGRKKLTQEKKKIKTGVTINSDLLEILESHLGDNNKSKYIENLIKEDLKKRGFEVKIEF